MAGFGALLYGALRAVCGIGQAVENKQMKDYSYGYTDKGEPTWLDRDCNRYINGEKVVATYDYKNQKLVYAGKNSGKVYYDPEQAQRDRLDEWSEKRKQEAIAEGKLAYMRYDHIRKKEITCEISTGKYIAKLEGRKDGTYWKYYLSPNAKLTSDKTPGDSGIQITQEEYDRLNIFGGTHYEFDENRYTFVCSGRKIIKQKRYKPLVSKENLPKVTNK